MRVTKLNFLRCAASHGLKTALRELLLMGLIFLPCAGLAQADFDLDWFAVASGGGNSSGGDFELSATVGQPEAGDMLGGDFSVIGGFWSIVSVVEAPVAVFLTVALSADSAIISWAESGTEGFDLEEASALAATAIGTVWTRVNATTGVSNGLKTVRLPLAAGNRFYRLHKP